MKDIIVRRTSIAITDYELGECPRLESYFKLFNITTHSYYYKGIYYLEEDKILLLPRGIDVPFIEKMFRKQAIYDDSYNEYDNIDKALLRIMPRDNIQKESLRFLLGKGEYSYTNYHSQLSVNLNTGKGKTFISIGALIYMQIKTIIITTQLGWLKQWKERILQYSNIRADEIYIVSGHLGIEKVINNKIDVSKIKIFLVTHSTIANYANETSWFNITEFFKALKVGMKIYDEAHLAFDNIISIDLFTNVFRTIYLTATPGRSDIYENRVYKLYMKNIPFIDLFDEKEDIRTEYLSIHYNSLPLATDISDCKNKYGLDRNKYCSYATSNERFYMLFTLLLNKFIFPCEGKVLIYIGTLEGIDKVYNWLLTNYPHLYNDIGIYTSNVKGNKREQLEKKIILSTTKSCGAAVDIKGLKITIQLAEPFKSHITTRQALGRTRDKNTLYIDVIDEGFAILKKYYAYKLPIYYKYATYCNSTIIRNDELVEYYDQYKDMNRPRYIIQYVGNQEG